MNFGIDPAVSTTQVRPFRPGRSSYFPIIRTDAEVPISALPTIFQKKAQFPQTLIYGVNF